MATAAERQTVDVMVSGGGTVFLITPQTDVAKTWFEEHLPADVQMLGAGVAVEHRYIGDVVEGMIEAGLVVR
jgi:hypothetical protein